MKILLLNPHIDAQHQVLLTLQGRGAALLMPENADEAWKMILLHGKSLDLAIIHREGAKGDDAVAGLKLLNRIKKDPQQADLPVILTSEQWDNPQFVQHQQTPEGANAYLRWPTEPAHLVEALDGIFSSASFEPPQVTNVTNVGVVPRAEGTRTRVPPLPQAEPQNGTKYVPLPPSAQAPVEFANPVLEDASGVYVGESSLGDNQIVLEVPDVPATRHEPTSTGAPSTSTPTSTAVRPPTAPLEFTSLSQVMNPPPAPAGTAPGTIAIPFETALEPGTIGLVPAAAPAPAPALTSDAPPVLEMSMLELPPLEGTGMAVDPPPAAPEASIRLEPSIPTAGPPTAMHTRALPTSRPRALAPREAPVEEEASEIENVVLSDSELARDLPYLFRSDEKPRSAATPPAFAPMLPPQPVDDAIVPGGAAHTPDVDTLKRYLLLREQDVATLSTQLKATRQQVTSLEELLASEQARNKELNHQLQGEKKKTEEAHREQQLLQEGLQREIEELKFQSKAKLDKARILEAQVRDATQEMERLKERVRADIRKIRMREKELENRLELSRKDSEVLIAARESKIIELKRKLDLLEFNMDLLQDQYAREKENSAKLRDRLVKAAQVMRVAGGVLDSPQPAAGTESSDDAAGAKDIKKREAS